MRVEAVGEVEEERGAAGEMDAAWGTTGECSGDGPGELPIGGEGDAIAVGAPAAPAVEVAVGARRLDAGRTRRRRWAIEGWLGELGKVSSMANTDEEAEERDDSTVRRT